MNFWLTFASLMLSMSKIAYLTIVLIFQTNLLKRVVISTTVMLLMLCC